ncbi:MAG: hypothetical protein AAFQ82_06455 [Myxococcota bacterium]
MAAGTSNLSAGRLATAVVPAMIAFYLGPLLARFNDQAPGTELPMTMALAALGGAIPAVILRRYPELRRAMRIRIPIAVTLMVATAALRHVLLYQAQWSSQALSGLTFLVLLAVGLIYVFPVDGS